MNRFENNVRRGITFGFILTLSFMVASIFGVVYGCNKIKDNGLKSCIERIWNGPTNTLSVATNSITVK